MDTKEGFIASSAGWPEKEGLGAQVWASGKNSSMATAAILCVLVTCIITLALGSWQATYKCCFFIMAVMPRLLPVCIVVLAFGLWKVWASGKNSSIAMASLASFLLACLIMLALGPWQVAYECCFLILTAIPRLFPVCVVALAFYWKVWTSGKNSIMVTLAVLCVLLACIIILALGPCQVWASGHSSFIATVAILCFLLGCIAVLAFGPWKAWASANNNIVAIMAILCLLVACRAILALDPLQVCAARTNGIFVVTGVLFLVFLAHFLGWQAPTESLSKNGDEAEAQSFDD